MPYIILSVDYRRGTNWGRSLEWLAPDLKDSGLAMTEDNETNDEGESYCGRCGKKITEAVDGGWEDASGTCKCGNDKHEPAILHRKWAGIIDLETYKKLAQSWDLDQEKSEPALGMLTETGYMDALAFDIDGMDWNCGGETPIEYVSLYVNLGQTTQG